MMKSIQHRLPPAPAATQLAIGKRGKVCERCNHSDSAFSTFAVVQRKCACGRTPAPTGECEACHNRKLQRSGRHQAAASSIPSIVQEVLHSSGEPLDSNTRGWMEARFGDAPVRPIEIAAKQNQLTLGPADDEYERAAEARAAHIMQRRTVGSPRKFDFGGVRIHADARSAESARAMNALAYTVGRDVVFGAGQYEPQSESGRRLIAHELTHVLQQRGLSSSPAYRCQFQFPEGFAGGARVPSRPLGEHVPKAPTTRPAEGELVEGFRVTPAMCYCIRSISIEEERAKKAIEAFRSCLVKERTLDGLYTCAKIKVYGSKAAAENAAQVPAAAETSSETGAITWATEAEEKERIRVLGHETHCYRLIVRAAILRHETKHIEQFDEIAKKLGAQFFAEFKALQGDAERMEKLRKQFPKETAQYEKKAVNKETVGPRRAAGMEIEALNRELQFYTGVRAALGNICKPHVPDVQRPEPERPSSQTPQPQKTHASQ
jgi:hypothetical protein